MICFFGRRRGGIYASELSACQHGADKRARGSTNPSTVMTRCGTFVPESLVSEFQKVAI
jgi:hypothetical protein